MGRRVSTLLSRICFAVGVSAIVACRNLHAPVVPGPQREQAHGSPTEAANFCNRLIVGVTTTLPGSITMPKYPAVNCAPSGSESNAGYLLNVTPSYDNVSTVLLQGTSPGVRCQMTFTVNSGGTSQSWTLLAVQPPCGLEAQTPSYNFIKGSGVCVPKAGSFHHGYPGTLSCTLN